MRVDGTRVDAQDNRRRLVAAVGRLLDRHGSLTLTQLADESGVSRSTTYRNFPTVDDAITAFIEDFLTDFEQAIDAHLAENPDPLQHLRQLCSAWGSLVDERREALIHVRSTEGFLARVRRGDPVITRIDLIVRTALDRAVDAEMLPPLDLDYAVFLWNLLFDPRELLDLAEHRSTSIGEVTDQITSDYLRLLTTADGGERTPTRRAWP